MKLNKDFWLNLKKPLGIFLIVVVSLFLGYSIRIAKIEQNISAQEWFGIVGSLSQAILVILGLFVFVQIKIAKDAFKTQCERDALTKSVSLAHFFADTVIPKMDNYYDSLKEKSFVSNARELSDFCMEDINLLKQDEQGKCRKDIKFFAEDKELRAKCIYVLNDLEALAINFTKLVADEKSLFTALSQSYCGFVEKNYAVICLFRKTKNDLYYVNMLDLYKTWSQKIKLSGLLVEKKGLDDKVAEISKMCNNKYIPKGL